MSFAAKKTFELKNKSFVAILNETNQDSITYYGGNQLWFDDPKKIFGGCAPVAAANILWYTLFSDETVPVTKTKFLEFMNLAYCYVHPLEIPFTNLSLGFFSYSAFSTGVKQLFLKLCETNFCLPNQNLRFNSYIMLFRSKKNKANAVNFIKNALDNNCPVALCTMFVFNNCDMEFINEVGIASTQKYDRHWVTITALVEDSDKLVLTVSTWGGIAKINFNTFWESINFTNLLLPSGLVCIEINKNY